MILIDEAITQSLSLIEPQIGGYHWRGRKFKSYINSDGKWYWDEAGDMTFHSAVLMNALAWAYKNTGREDIKNAISKLLDYFLLGQHERNGCLIRDFVDAEAYVKFPASEQNSDKEPGVGGGLVDSGPAMKYLPVGLTYNGNSHLFMMRYDISMDAISQVVSALYWVKKFVPEFSNRVTEIASNQLKYYAANNWKILDSKGKPVRYGDHTPSLFVPMGRFVQILLRHLTGRVEERKLLDRVLNLLLRTYIPGVYKSKKTRYQFNNYMFTNILFALVDAGYDFDALLKRMIGETADEYNYHSAAISNYRYKTSLPIIQSDLDFVIRHTNWLTYVTSPVALKPWVRYGNNCWEDSAYTMGTVPAPEDIPLGQEDIIQAWYLY